MRSAQDFDAFEVEELAHLRERRADIDTVGVDRDGAGGVGVEVVEADAADEDFRVRSVVVCLDLKTGREGIEIQHVGDAEVLQLFAADSGDRDRDFLQILRALVGGDDDDVPT